MKVWEVHVTHRGDDGERISELYGAYPVDELPSVLQSALRRAHEADGGIQIVPQLDPPRRR